ncbi:MAG: glutathione S-transferase N-terminal domain-containing protein [Chloroflexi bacterium]|nr:glutathione S-transferase N-terminal domain-containing protein [Chloroflexota bacterium]
MPSSDLIVYGTEWCGDCRRTRRYLERRNIPFTWINIDQDKAAEAFVIKTNRGMRSVPTLVFPDGAILVEPSNLALAEKLGIPV